jgi:hypothetical protein
MDSIATKTMIIKSEFKADLFQLKHCAAPEVLINELKDRAAIELGREIAKVIPFEKIDELSHKGPIPAMSLNRDHQYVDHYRAEFYLLPIEDYALLRSALAGNPNYCHLLSLLK